MRWTEIVKDATTCLSGNIIGGEQGCTTSCYQTDLLSVARIKNIFH